MKLDKVTRNYITRVFTPAFESLDSDDASVETVVGLRAIAVGVVRELELLAPDIASVRLMAHEGIGMCERERPAFDDPAEPDRLRALFEDLLARLKATDRRPAPRRGANDCTYRGGR